MLVRIVKGWIGPDFLSQTPGGEGLWDGIRFTFDPVEECDYLIMLNNQMKTDVTVRCQRENVWAIMQEPYRKGHTDWMVEKHHAFDRILTNHRPSNDPKYVVSHPADPWHVKRTFDQLVSMAMPPKTGVISWIAGNPMDLPGHRQRLAFLQYVRRHDTIGIDYFGRAIRYIDDKWDGLAPYKYSIVIQNSSSPDYWTDVVADSFLSWTVPIYWGCTNIEDYFPAESFIRIDLDDPEASLETIRKTVREDRWEKRLPALKEARRMILYRYQFFPHISGLIRREPHRPQEATTITIPAYRRSLKARFFRLEYKWRRLFTRSGIRKNDWPKT